ncbi:MAG: Na+/solute symporter [Planctomycetota bacterium]|nr:MAG: Na+/solute symporter [Planctomycetota bacterium]
MDESQLSLNAGLEWQDFAAIAFYFVLTFGIALWFGRKQKDVDDFFVGGRRMPWFAVGLSILATLFSTLSYLGMPGEMIKNGVGVFMGYLAVPFSMAVVTLLWIPFFMRLKLTSAYEYLELRFNYPVRLIGASLFVLLRLGWMSMVIFAASMALDRVKGPDIAFLPGPDIYWWIGLVGVIAAIYTAVGGIQAMIWTDVLQCLLLLAGVLLAIGYVAAVDGTGPIDWWKTASNTSGRNNLPPVFSWDITVRVTIVFALINNFFWTVCTHGSDQVVLQRYFSVSSLKNARKSYFINFIVDLSMATLLSLCGLALLAFYLKHADLTPDGLPAVKAANAGVRRERDHGRRGQRSGAASASRSAAHPERPDVRSIAKHRDHSHRHGQRLFRGEPLPHDPRNAGRDDAEVLQPVRRPAGVAVHHRHVSATLYGSVNDPRRRMLVWISRCLVLVDRNLRHRNSPHVPVGDRGPVPDEHRDRRVPESVCRTWRRPHRPQIHLERDRPQQS